ncbi:MAG: molybdenum ABC transporter ATP-binding protein [Syntrophales bacterium]|nr:molybdenum ABC transporter ATP-binding protein [Syntrophales bacterium]
MELQVKVDKRLGGFFLDMDFICQGQRTGLFGPSGSGKSTLVDLIAGLRKPDNGSILLDGERLYDSGKGICLPPERRRIGIVFQHPHLFPHLSVKGNLLYGRKRSALGHTNIDFVDLVETLQIGELLERGVNNLSGGEKQRVAIGRAVLANPRLLLMDEPLSALQDALKFQIIPYLKDVSERFGIPYLFISHSLTEMRLVVDRTLVVSAGRVVVQSSPDELARSPMGLCPGGFVNLLKPTSPRRVDGLFVYDWDGGELCISEGDDRPDPLFTLPSRDVILFRRHPEAISARNLFRCTVTGTFPVGAWVGIKLDCRGERLVAEVVKAAAKELECTIGGELFAAIKASSFRKLN